MACFMPSFLTPLGRNIWVGHVSSSSSTLNTLQYATSECFSAPMSNGLPAEELCLRSCAFVLCVLLEDKGFTMFTVLAVDIMH